MSAHLIEFGFLPHTCDFVVGDFSIVTLRDLRESIDAVNAEPTVEKGWVYAPPQRQRDIFRGKERELPYPARVFGLPKTHRLVFKRRQKKERIEFLIWCLAFFTGFRLSSTEAGFLDSTPIASGKLTDFALAHRDIKPALELANAFWMTHRQNPDRAKMVGAIVHVLFLSQNPRHLPFEEFMYLYTALDGCYALLESVLNVHPKNRPTHAKRVEWMCKHFRMRVPRWAKPRGKQSRISAVRNASFHEALFFDQPLGFSIFKTRPREGAGGVLLEMQAIVCRLLVALLGKPKSRYFRSKIHTRQIHGLSL